MACRTIMNGLYRGHPDEDALERFVLNRSEEGELETVETHIMACEECVTRLEALEFEIAAAKLALRDFHPAKTSRKAWRFSFTLPQLSFAGAALAACALAVTFLSMPREAGLTANRGVETSVVPRWRPLNLHLGARELQPGPVSIEVVDVRGGAIWRGPASVRNDEIDVKIPRLTAEGKYFIRVYEGRDLLREFSIQTRPLF